MAADIVTALDDEGASGGAPRRVAEDGTGAGDGVFQGGYGGATGIIEVPSDLEIGAFHSVRIVSALGPDLVAEPIR